MTGRFQNALSAKKLNSQAQTSMVNWDWMGEGGDESLLTLAEKKYQIRKLRQ